MGVEAYDDSDASHIICVVYDSMTAAEKDRLYREALADDPVVP